MLVGIRQSRHFFNGDLWLAGDVLKPFHGLRYGELSREVLIVALSIEEDRNVVFSRLVLLKYAIEQSVSGCAVHFRTNVRANVGTKAWKIDE